MTLKLKKNFMQVKIKTPGKLGKPLYLYVLRDNSLSKHFEELRFFYSFFFFKLLFSCIIGFLFTFKGVV